MVATLIPTIHEYLIIYVNLWGLIWQPVMNRPSLQPGTFLWFIRVSYLAVMWGAVHSTTDTFILIHYRPDEILSSRFETVTLCVTNQWRYGTWKTKTLTERTFRHLYMYSKTDSWHIWANPRPVSVLRVVKAVSLLGFKRLQLVLCYPFWCLFPFQGSAASTFESYTTELNEYRLFRQACPFQVDLHLKR